MDINTFNKMLTLNYYKSLIEFSNKKNINDDISWLTDYYNNLFDNNISSKTSSESDCKSFFEDINLYKKPWQKLNNIHKNIKIREFVNRFGITDSIEKSEMADKLINLIKTNKINKNDIDYDEINGYILAIPKLVYDNNCYIYKEI
jgi:hypothetical protein